MRERVVISQAVRHQNPQTEEVSLRGSSHASNVGGLRQAALNRSLDLAGKQTSRYRLSGPPFLKTTAARFRWGKPGGNNKTATTGMQLRRIKPTKSPPKNGDLQHTAPSHGTIPSRAPYSLKVAVAVRVLAAERPLATFCAELARSW